MTKWLFSLSGILLIGFLSPSPVRATDSKLSYLFSGNSPQPVAMVRREAWRHAERVAAQHVGDFVVRGDGPSMGPLYPSGTVLVIERVSYGQLKQGATVLYRNKDGRPIAHLLVTRSRDGWSTAGLGNRYFDDESVLPENLLGIVKYAFTPVDLPPPKALRYAAR